MVWANRLVGLAFPDQGGAEVVVDFGGIRFQAAGFLVLADRPVNLAFCVEGVAEVIMGFGVIRFEADGFLELADGFVDLALFVEGVSEVVVGIGVIRFEVARGFAIFSSVEGRTSVQEGEGMLRIKPDSASQTSPISFCAASVNAWPWLRSIRAGA